MSRYMAEEHAHCASSNAACIAYAILHLADVIEELSQPPAAEGANQ